MISRCRAALPEIELGRIDSALGRLQEVLDLAEAAGMREAMMYALTGIGRAWAASSNDEPAAILLAFVDGDHNPYRSFATSALASVAERVGSAAMDEIRGRAAELSLDKAVRLARVGRLL